MQQSAPIRTGSSQTHCRSGRLTTAMLAMLVAGPLAVTTPARASVFTWAGVIDDGWNTNMNWSPSGLPGSDDVISFLNPTFNPVVRLNGNRSVLWIDFGGPADYELRPDVSTDTLTLIDGDIVSNGLATFEISSDLVMADTGEWDIDGSSTLEVSGRVTGEWIHKTGTGMLLMTGGTADSPSSLEKLRLREGEIVIDGADDGADLELTSTATSLSGGPLTVMDADVTIRNGATVVAASGNVHVRDNCTLTLTGNGTSLAGNDMRIAQEGDAASVVIVEEGSELSFRTLLIG